MKSQRWVPLWVDADSKKCQICVVQMTKNPGTLFLSYTLSTQGVPTSRDNFSGSGGMYMKKERASFWNNQFDFRRNITVKSKNMDKMYIFLDFEKVHMD